MKTICLYLLVICLSCSLFGCGKTSFGDRLEISPRAIAQSAITAKKTTKLAEVAPPKIIQELGKSLEKYQPQVSILNPKKEKIYTDNTIKVQLKVKNFPLFKNEKLGLGPHLHLILDNEPYQAIYDLDKLFTLKSLTPGTHTLRVFASRPWHESFKTSGAYAQTTFHVLTKTNKNNPDSSQPLLTYSRPNGSYGSEPIMLDFYLTNAPNHLEAKRNSEDEIKDWHIKVTVNGESFLIDDWKPIYLEGFKRGNNWVQLELIDEEGNSIDNAFNNTIRLITYEPENQDTLAQLITGELSLDEVRGIVEENYQPETISIPETKETPTNEPTPEVKDKIESEAKPEIIPEPEIEPNSSDIKEEKTLVKPRVNDTPPAVPDELNSLTEKVIEIEEPNLDAVPIPEESESLEKAEATEEKLKMPDLEDKQLIEQE